MTQGLGETNMKHLYKLSFSLFLLQAVAPAAVLLDQPLALIDARSSSTVDGSQGFQTWERFSLVDSVSVNRISWVGAFLDLTNNANNPVNPDADSWQFVLANDAANAPGGTAYSANMAFGDVMQSLLGNSTIAGRAVKVYRFTADLLTPMSIAGGNTMWLSIYSINDTTEPTFAWTSGSGGDGVSKQYLFQSGALVNQYTDRSLTLEGSAVPEPGTYALIGAGCLMIGMIRRQRKS